jgi:protease I
MDEKKLQSIEVAILVTDGFEQAELEEPRKALELAGAHTTVVAPKVGKIQGMKHDQKTITVDATRSLDKTSPDDFDAVLLPGGAFNADALRMEAKAQDFVRKMDKEGKPIAVICHAPWLLVSAGLVKGRTMTSYHTIQDDIDIGNAGGEWKDQEVVRDANWVSSRQPTDIPAFNREMIALFSERKTKARGA